jgi:3-phenylpropionate/cinnamic acid dioxygenase small subunit
MAWAEDPPSRTRHLIGNLEAAALENGEVEAKTAFLVYRSHLEKDRQLLSGCRDDVLRKVNGAWKGEEAHDRARRQSPARQEPQRLPLRLKTGSGATWN